MVKKTCASIASEYHQWVNEQPDNREETKLEFSLQLRKIDEIRSEILSHAVVTSHHEDGNEIYLNQTQISELKNNKVEFLTKSYARFQWVSSFTLNKEPAFKLLFDATEISQGNAISGIYIENKNVADAVLLYFKLIATAVSDIGAFYNSFLKILKKPKEDLYSHLDETYGSLRAPKYIRESEIFDGKVGEINSAKCFYDATDKSLSEVFHDIGIANIEDGVKAIWAIS